MDGGSSDGTVKEAVKVAGDRRNFRLVVDESAKTPARGRNRGVENASGWFVAFTDSDCMPEPEWIQRLASSENWAEEIGAVGGRTLFTNLPDDSGMLSALHGALETRLGSGGSAQFFDYETGANVRSLPSCNVMYRTDVFLEHGGFDESLRYCEDSCLNSLIRRSGYKLSYLSQAIVRHEHRGSTRRFVRWIYDYGKGRSRAVRKDWKAISLPVGLLGIVFVLLFLLAVAGVLSLGALFYSAFAVYCTIAFASAFLNAQRRSGKILLYFAGYFLIHCSYIAGLIAGLVTPPAALIFSPATPVR